MINGLYCTQSDVTPGSQPGRPRVGVHLLSLHDALHSARKPQAVLTHSGNLSSAGFAVLNRPAESVLNKSSDQYLICSTCACLGKGLSWRWLQTARLYLS